MNQIPSEDVNKVYLLQMLILLSEQLIDFHRSLDHSDPRSHPRGRDFHFRLPWLNTKVYRQDPLRLYTDSMIGRSI
jgi:hypothetical protein